MSHHAPRPRDYSGAASKQERRRLRDVDAADRMMRLKAGMWSLAVVWIATAAGALTGLPVSLVFLGAVGAGVAVYLVSTTIALRAGAAAQMIYAPSGHTTPHKREYSYAESLVKRGQYGDAAAAYELYALENPTDPEPYLRLARLYRDQLNQLEDAVTWFRRARADAALSPGQQMLVIQDLVDVYIRRLKMPRKAMPELALLVERFPGTPAAQAAERELAEMREMLERERQDMIPFTVQFLRKVGRGSVGAAAAEAAAELERHMVREVLAECGGDKARAAERLGVSVEEVEGKLASGPGVTPGEATDERQG